MREAVDEGSRIATWWQRPAAGPNSHVDHAMTVDVEDYFQVEAFAGVVKPEDWDKLECRIERNVDRILELFAEAGATATFFTLGWIGERYPTLVRRIVSSGHELASHGFAHQRADRQDEKVFFADICRARAVLEDCAGKRVNGYRAPCFSVGPENLWAFDALVRAGYRYSSSVYPVQHDRYGVPNAPHFAFHPLAGSEFVEIPVTTVRRFGKRWPCGGGGYFRLLPYSLSVRNMRAAAKSGQPCIFYFHPWEIDPEQPRVMDAPAAARFRHYVNIGKMQARMRKLLSEFRWNRIDSLYPIAHAADTAA